MSRRTMLAATSGMVVAMVVLTQSSCSKAENPWDKIKGGNLKVLVTFPPLYCFAKGVAGDDDAKVETLLVRQGPHEHTPAAADAYLASGADLFLANGLTLDDFVTKVAGDSHNRRIKVIMVAEKALPKDKLLHFHHDEDEHDEPGHKHGEFDPHAWLGIEQAILMVNTIRDIFKEADPIHAGGYDTRAAAYVKKLKTLQADGKKLLEGKKNRKLIAMHESLGYFCKSFQLDLVDSVMPRPGVEADGQKLAELVKVCQKDNIKIMAIEPQYPKNKAQTLSDSLLRQKDHVLHLVEIDPLETCAAREELNDDYYFKVMRRNLENLAKKME